MLTQASGSIKPKSSAKSVALFLPDQPRPVAFLRGSTLQKSLRSMHILTRPAGAIGFDERVLDEARRRGATRIVVKNRETGTVYESSMDNFYRYALRVSRGYGPQLALEAGRWCIDGAQPELESREAAQAAKRCQLNLFDDGGDA